jgi:hypothetical protein
MISELFARLVAEIKLSAEIFPEDSLCSQEKQVRIRRFYTSFQTIAGQKTFFFFRVCVCKRTRITIKG